MTLLDDLIRWPMGYVLRGTQPLFFTPSRELCGVQSRTVRLVNEIALRYAKFWYCEQ